jgi:hypothetical protein
VTPPVSSSLSAKKGCLSIVVLVGAILLVAFAWDELSGTSGAIRAVHRAIPDLDVRLDAKGLRCSWVVNTTDETRHKDWKIAQC